MNRFTDFTKLLIFTTMIVILHATAAVTDDDFTPYVKEFEKACGITSGSIINFGNSFEKHVIGYCTPSNKNIKINRKYWNTADSYERELLIFHELGHCDLNRDHTEGYRDQDPKFIPVSIMGAEIFGANIYMANRDYYIKELCDNRK